MSDLTLAAAALNNLRGEYQISRDQFVDLAGGPVDGGPDGIGWYPLMRTDGTIVMLPSIPTMLALIAGQRGRVYATHAELLAASTEGLSYGDGATVGPSDSGTHGAPDPAGTPNTGIYVWTDGGASADYWRWTSGLLVTDLTALVTAAQAAVADALAASVEFAVSAPRAAITLSAAGAASPSEQSTTIVATLNRELTVSWQVFDGAGVAKEPTVDFLSAATGDAVTITAAQAIAAAGATRAVQIKASVTFEGRTIDRWWSLALIRDGAAGAGGGGATMVPLVSGALPGPDFLADDFGRPILIPYVES